jgi:imidazolonepropionase-like amidohydrolase
VAAVRDGGDRRGDVGRYRQLKDGSAPPVHIAATCWAWHASGRYGSMIGQAPSDGLSAEQAVAMHLSGCDHLKIIQSGLNSLDRFGYQGRPQFAAEDLQAMVKTAHDAGLPVMVHANGEPAVRMAVEAGCDSIEHGYFMGADNLKRMADRGTCWVPTAIPMAALAEAPGLCADQRDVARRTLDVQMAQIRQAHEWGVIMALGTDAGSQGVDHGLAVKQELALLMSAGLDVGQAVRCATANGARLLGLTGRGGLLPGGRADFIAVPGPPENLPHSLADITAICLDGRWYDPVSHLVM